MANFFFPPNNTIYINNLDEKMKIPDLKTALFLLFSEIGEVVEVYAKRTLKMRGQAFVAFRNIFHSIQALHTMQGFPLNGKPMRIQFSKSDSEIIARLRVPPTCPPWPGNEQPQNHNAEIRRILFVQNVPDDTDIDFLQNIFRQFKGFSYFQCVPGCPELAFVAYETGTQAENVKNILSGYEITPKRKLDVQISKRTL